MTVAPETMPVGEGRVSLATALVRPEEALAVEVDEVFWCVCDPDLRLPSDHRSPAGSVCPESLARNRAAATAIAAREAVRPPSWSSAT